MYSSTLSLTSVVDGAGWSTPHPGLFTPEKEHSTRFTGGWVDPRAGLEEYGISCPTGIQSPDRPGPGESL